MNKRQMEFVKILESHLAQEVSLHQMRAWLSENIKQAIHPETGAFNKPGMWLEIYAYRTIRGHITDIEDPTISRKSELNWYWEDIRRILDLLLGNQIYKRTVYLVEYPLQHKRRKQDEKILPILKYVEEVFHMLVMTQEQQSGTFLKLPKLDLSFEISPLSSQTSSEILIDEMLSTIEDYEYLVNNPMSSREYSGSIDRETAQLDRLGKLIKCFKGELYYSMSGTFEGFDKFAITIIVV